MSPVVAGDPTESTPSSGTLVPRRDSLQEIVTRHIREAILRGDLLPGERLLEEELARELGVSRNPVREAIRTLAATGLVEVTPRRGASVVRITPGEADELFEVRAVLDGFAARLAARRHDADDLEALEADVQRQRDRAGELDPEGRPTTASQFHLLVVRAGRNRFLMSLIEPLEDKSRLLMATRVRLEPLWREHVAILEAIASGDEDKAEELARLHVDRAREALRGQR